MSKRTVVLIMFILSAVLAACGGQGGAASPGRPDPAVTVERYLTAKVEGDADTVRALLCSEMEASLERETRTFESVSGARLDGMACTAESAAVVRCDGRIVATYGTEETEFPLSSYRVVEEDGEWRWCGESE